MCRHDRRPEDWRGRDAALAWGRRLHHTPVRAERLSLVDVPRRNLALCLTTTHSDRAVRPSQQPKIEHPYVARVPRSSLADAGCTRCARAGADADVRLAKQAGPHFGTGY